MLKKLSAMKARQNLGEIMNEVSMKGDDYIIERAGKPLVAIISMEKYGILKKEREKAFGELNIIWKKLEKENPEMIERTIDEAVKSVRNL
jgi:prevent-host-death family protein